MARKKRVGKLAAAVLRQAIADGGKVVLTGLDRHPLWDGRHVNAARALHEDGYGQFTPEDRGFYPAEFKILPAGRDLLQKI